MAPFLTHEAAVDRPSEIYLPRHSFKMRRIDAPAVNTRGTANTARIGVMAAMVDVDIIGDRTDVFDVERAMR